MTGAKSTGWKPTMCRAGCAYAGEKHKTYNECLYQAVTGHSRGCDPGKGCSCYRKLRPGERKPRSIDEIEGLKPAPVVRRKRRKRKCTWDTVKGYSLYREGKTSGQIAEALGISKSAVMHRRQEQWNHGEA